MMRKTTKVIARCPACKSPMWKSGTYYYKNKSIPKWTCSSKHCRYQTINPTKVGK